MFDFFRSRTYKKFLKTHEQLVESTGTYDMSNEITPEVKHTDARFMVGTTNEGMVQLRVGYPSSIVLTMNNDAVRRLIALLQAAMVNDSEEQE